MSFYQGVTSMNPQFIQLYLFFIGLLAALFLCFLVVAIFFSAAEKLQGGSFIATFCYCWKHW